MDGRAEHVSTTTADMSQSRYLFMAAARDHALAGTANMLFHLFSFFLVVGFFLVLSCVSQLQSWNTLASD